MEAGREQDPAISEDEVRDTLLNFDPSGNELFPAEQARIVQLLVERVDVGVDGISIALRTDGLASMMQDLRRPAVRRGEAA